MSLASLEAFLARALEDPPLRELLVAAPDAATVAAIAQAAGFPVSELDLWQATAASPDEVHPSVAHAPSPEWGGEARVGTVGTSEKVAAALAGEAGIESEPEIEPEPESTFAPESEFEPEREIQAKPEIKVKAEETTPASVLPDPWLEQEPLSAFVHQAQGDAELRQALASAPDAAAVASIAQAAGYPISEVDLWLASGTSPDELAASLRPRGVEEPVEDVLVEDESRVDEVPLDRGFSGDEELLRDERVLANEDLFEGDVLPEDEGFSVAEILPEGEGLSASDVPSEVDIPVAIDDPSVVLNPLGGEGGSQGGAPFPGDDSFASDDSLLLGNVFADEGHRAGGAALAWEGVSGEDDLAAATATPEDELSPRASAEEAIRQLLWQAQADEALRQALTGAPDVSAVAAIAQAAGHPISELALWLASGASFEEAQPEPEPTSLEDDPLTLFLRAVEVDPDLQIVLASAPDAATVAAIARIAGFPLTAADLWAASDAVPQELVLQELIFADLAADEMVVVVD